MQRSVKNIQTCGAVLWLLGSSAFLIAQENKPAEVKPVESQSAEGEMKLGNKTYKLGHVVAYESTVYNEPRINILMSDRKVPINEIKAALTEGEGSDQSLLLDQPHLKLVFKKSGKVTQFNAIGGGTTISSSSDELKAEFTLENGRIKGQAKLPPEGDGALQRSFEVKYDVALGLDQGPKPVRPAGPVKPTVTGTFKGNGKPAKLAFVSAHPGEPFDDKPSVVLVITEMDHSKEKKPENKAAFGDFGSALIISMHENGKIFGCEVSHSAHQKRPFSSVGAISTGEFDLGDGQVSGLLKTDGEEEFFGETWEVDLKFAAPFVAAASTKPVVVAEKPTAKKSRKSKKKPAETPTEDKPAADNPTEPAADMLSIYDLALPKDATDKEFKTVVKHFAFSSKSDVAGLAKEFSKSLADQGWETDGSDLVTPKSAILRRKRGEASMTIFVKPSDKGSRATMFTEGLDWTKKDETKTEKESQKD